MTNAAVPLSPLIQQAMAASQNGDTARALQLLGQASQNDPGSSIPHFLMGSEYASLGQIEQAELAFSNAVILTPSIPIARYQLGLLQYSTGRPANALVTWQPLLALGEQSPLTHWVQGFAALTQNQLEAARIHFVSGIERNTDNPPMSADIRKVLAEIDAAQLAANVPPNQDSMPHEGDEAEASSHFLVSNYGRQGPSH